MPGIIDLQNRFRPITGGLEFTFTAAGSKESKVNNYGASGIYDGGHKAYLVVQRKGTYTKNALTEVKLTLSSADTEGGSYQTDAVLSVPVAKIDAKSEFAKITMPEGMKAYHKLTIEAVGAPTALTIVAGVTVS